MKDHEQLIQFCRGYLMLSDEDTAQVLRDALDSLGADRVAPPADWFKSWLETLDFDAPRCMWRAMTATEVARIVPGYDSNHVEFGRMLTKALGPCSGNRRTQGKKRARMIPPVKIESLL